MSEIQPGAGAGEASAALEAIEAAAFIPEPRFRDALAALKASKRSVGALVLVVSLALFLLLQEDRSPAAIAALAGVLLFHELGHYLGMRLFGYGDVRMFFIPFFGAAVSGKRRGAAAWKEGVVLLLGPLPGIVAALVVAVRIRHEPLEAVKAWRDLTMALVTINVFNLLPLAGMDGARLLQHVLFSRRRWLDVSFQILAALGLAWVAIDSGSYALGIFTYLMLIGLPFRWRLLGAADRWRRSGVPLPLDARELVADQTGRAVFAQASDVVKRDSPKMIASAMEQLVDAVNARPPSFGASAALMFAWLLAFPLALVALGLLYRPPLSPGSTTLVPPPVVAPQSHEPRLRLGGDDEFQLKLKPPGE
jgi:Zn-dependent protease